MWPFSKNPLDPPAFPQGSWSVREGKIDGAPIITRFNVGAEELLGHPGLPFRLGIAVPLLEPEEFGLPTPTEFRTLSRIEDALITALESARRGVLVMSHTTGVMREFVFYVRSKSDAATATKAALGVGSGHAIQHYIEKDPTWSVYQEFAKPSG
jgi:hypothetical protein